MSSDRRNALTTITENCGVAHAHITRENLLGWVDPLFPIHPAFPYLSAVHQCDYLRCYTLHVYGGGYTDIKPTVVNWRPFYSLLLESPAYGIGYQEVGPHGVARVGGDLEELMKGDYKKLIGLCSMIFRPNTRFTRKWFQSVNTLLDDNYEILRVSPAKHPLDRRGARFADGEISKYPLAWTGVGGDIFHPLVYEFHQNILQGEFSPRFTGYK